jgi:hypothetical protein
METRTYGWALLLSDSDHRRQTIDGKIARLKEFKLPSARIVETAGPFQLVFGHQPYHIFLKLEADSPDALLQAFAALEENFSHVEGFI